MIRPQIVPFGEWSVDLCANGPSSFIKPDFSRIERTDAGTILWDPGVAGLLGSVSLQREDSDHQGERHIDGDELLYLISGSMRLVLIGEGDTSEGDTSEEVSLAPGEAVLVPRGCWHRLRIDVPSFYISFGGGRTEIRSAGDREAGP